MLDRFGRDSCTAGPWCPDKRRGVSALPPTFGPTVGQDGGHSFTDIMPMRLRERARLVGERCRDVGGRYSPGLTRASWDTLRTSPLCGAAPDPAGLSQQTMPPDGAKLMLGTTLGLNSRCRLCPASLHQGSGCNVAHDVDYVVAFAHLTS